MKKNTQSILRTVLALIACTAFSVFANAQRMKSLDLGWKFYRGTTMNAESPEFDDSKWRTLNVPHDFSIEPAFDASDPRTRMPGWDDFQVGPFVRMNLGDSDAGQTIGGEGWYRKTFSLPVSGNASLDTYLAMTDVNIRFDGVYNQAEVWVNGKKAAVNVFGYMPFKVNINEILADKSLRSKDDERKVTVVVRSLNEGLNCRWYAGSGIFRHVWLTASDKLHLDEWDVFVDGSEIIPKKGANVKVFAKVHNEEKYIANGDMIVDILDAEGNQVASVKKPFSVAGTTSENYEKDGQMVETELMVKVPHVWSVDDPYRYKARVTLIKTGEERDALVVPFGIRSISFSAKEGFKLNGKETKLRGGCVHHDNGLLGGAAIDRAEVRKVELLKAQGYNAIRCSHNLPSEALLYACDSLGMLVIDEVFDQWEEAKRKDDYSNYFSKEKLAIVDGKMKGMGITNFEYDAALMVRRDRNHPSVIMWSIGNEIAQRSDEPRGKEIALAINLAINNEDGTRPTTMAVNDFWDRTAKKYTWEDDSPRAFENVEVGGYNYETRRYESDHEAFPDRIMYGSESYPGAVAENWNLIEKHPYIIGDFVWTAVDYIGEAGLGHTLERSDTKNWIQLLTWPYFNSWCGDIDLIGVKKPQSYYRDVVWGQKKIAMAVRPSVTEGEYEDNRGWGWTAEENHWNWHLHGVTGEALKQAKNDASKRVYLPLDLRPEKYKVETLAKGVTHDVNAHRSDSMRVNVYTREERVRLLINDSVMGEQDVNPETYTATFTVAYEPGQLKAEVVANPKAAAKKAKTGKKGDKALDEAEMEVHFNTSLAPSSISFEAVDSIVTASHNDLAYIYINIVDEEGNLCPTAELPLKIETSGAKHVAVAGTGHPFDMKSFRSLTPTTFRGRALLVIQPQEEQGTVTVKVSGKGIESGEYTVEFK